MPRYVHFSSVFYLSSSVAWKVLKTGCPDYCKDRSPPHVFCLRMWNLCFFDSQVVIRYFEPTTMTCLMEPWFRELGFSIFYGAIILKIYRYLSSMSVVVLLPIYCRYSLRLLWHLQRKSRQGSHRQ